MATAQMARKGASTSKAVSAGAPARSTVKVKPPVAEPAEERVERQAQRRVDQPGTGDNADLNTLGGRITWARTREEVTQEELANAIGKVRPTVVQYEGSRILPPLDIVEKIAKFLKVSPSFIAFGEHGVKTVGNAAEDVVNIEEITFGRDGEYQSGVFAMSRKLVTSLVDNPRHLKCYVMNHAAPLFDLKPGDRVFADTSYQSFNNAHDTYLLDTTGGLQIVRVEPSFTKSATISAEGPNGKKMTLKVKDLKVIGAMVSSLRSA